MVRSSKERIGAKETARCCRGHKGISVPLLPLKSYVPAVTPCHILLLLLVLGMSCSHEHWALSQLFICQGTFKWLLPCKPSLGSISLAMRERLGWVCVCASTCVHVSELPSLCCRCILCKLLVEHLLLHTHCVMFLSPWWMVHSLKPPFLSYASFLCCKFTHTYRSKPNISYYSIKYI